MSEKTEYIKQMAQEKLSCVYDQIDKARSDIDSTIGQTKQDLESKIGLIKADLHSRKEDVNLRKSKFEAMARKQLGNLESKVMEIKEKVESKKEDKVKKRLVNKAEKAEKYAEICMECAGLSVVEAELACLEACYARQEAEEVVGNF